MNNSDEVKIEVLKRTLIYLVGMHHRIIGGSGLHNPGNIRDFRICEALTCKKVTEILDNLEDGRLCLHKNVRESADFRNANRRDDSLTHWYCLICGDYFPLIGDTDCWPPKLLTQKPTDSVADELAKDYPKLWKTVKIIDEKGRLQHTMPREEIELEQLMNEVWLSRRNRKYSAS